jgi:hypothetical protein
MPIANSGHLTNNTLTPPTTPSGPRTPPVAPPTVGPTTSNFQDYLNQQTVTTVPQNPPPGRVYDPIKALEQASTYSHPQNRLLAE